MATSAVTLGFESPLFTYEADGVLRDGRIRHWVYVVELGRYLPVVGFQAAVATRFEYFAETGTLYIQLQDGSGTDSKEVAENVLLDFDDAGQVIGIEIEHASERTDLRNLQLASVPLISTATGAA